jgi:hypothetical protein
MSLLRQLLGLLGEVIAEIMITNTIDNIPICEPIKKVIGILENNGGQIIEEKISDYHFNELFFKIVITQHVEIKDIEGIKMYNSNIYHCN